jgi:Anti-sigma-K factor rskA
MDHEAIQELLAGYVLWSLSGDDAAEADRVLSEHVPGCDECRATLDAFHAVAGDLALDAPVVAPPDTLRARLQRELEPRVASRWNAGRIVAIAASVVVVVGVGAVALTRGGGGLANGQIAHAELRDIASAAVNPDTSREQLGGNATELVSPATEKLYVYGVGVSQPPPGMVYRLWTVSPDTQDATYIGDFLPADDGMLLLEITIPASSVGQLLVTIEPAGSEPTTPGQPAWASDAA